MSNTPGRGRNQRIAQFAVPEGEVVSKFDTYAEAVDFVDQLIRHDFPAPMVAIVGSDLRSVERVRGKLSYGSVAVRGLIAGSWVGLIIGVFVGQPVAGQTGGINMGAAIFIGAGVGMLVNVLRFSLTRNRHEFSSASAVIAARYEVIVPHPLAGRAQQAIEEHQRECVNGHKH